ncbi:MAG: hypothetical protein GY722_23755, partial [bacterium]|nr:hypothetical protein [bacterium]
MPRAHTRGTAKARTISDVDPTVFDLKQLFPKKEGFEQGPLPEQRQVYEWITSGAARDGGIVYQGGKGSAKTLCGAGAIIMSHLIWPKLRSVVGRETYASLCTSTWIDFRDMLERVPKYHIAAVSAPSKNSMGYVEWKNGGTTLFVSLSDNKTWESANIGLAWPDEGHLQNPEMVSKLQERIRQTNDKADPAQDFPRVMLITTNP